MMSKVFAYGTKDAIKILSAMQQQNYLNATLENKDNNKPIAYYIILACQVKNDLTGVKINPELWYKMRLTDYEKMRKGLVKATNEIVSELELSKFLAIN